MAMSSMDAEVLPPLVAGNDVQQGCDVLGIVVLELRLTREVWKAIVPMPMSESGITVGRILALPLQEVGNVHITIPKRQPKAWDAGRVEVDYTYGKHRDRTVIMREYQ